MTPANIVVFGITIAAFAGRPSKLLPAIALVCVCINWIWSNFMIYGLS